MRNRYAGVCYRCHRWCGPGDGHFERFGRGFRVQHATCAIAYRGRPDPAREQLILDQLQQRASGTGKRAQRARRKLKDLLPAPKPIRFEDF